MRAASTLKEALFLMQHTMAIDAAMDAVLSELMPALAVTFGTALAFPPRSEDNIQTAMQVCDALECGVRSELVKILNVLWQFGQGKRTRT